MESLVASVPAVRAALGAAAVTVVTAVAVRLGAGAVDLPAVLVVVAATALTVPLGYGLLVAVTGWAMLTGFVVNTAGTLTFHHGDLGHLALLAGVGLAAWTLGRGAGVGVTPRGSARGSARVTSPQRVATRAGSPARSR